MNHWKKGASLLLNRYQSCYTIYTSTVLPRPHIFPLIVLHISLLAPIIGSFTAALNSISYSSSYNFFFSLPASLIPRSPSTKTHHPSPPPPSPPPTAASNSLLANSNPSRSKLPGCNHTALIPASFASARILRVIAGGVMIEREVWSGTESWEGDATVERATVCRVAVGLIWCMDDGVGRYFDNGVYVRFMTGDDGLSGVAGRECAAYQARTMRVEIYIFSGQERGSLVPLYPYLLVSFEAPATA